MKKTLFFISALLLVNLSSANANEYAVAPISETMDINTTQINVQNQPYDTDRDYLLDKINEFKSIDITKKEIGNQDLNITTDNYYTANSSAVNANNTEVFASNKPFVKSNLSCKFVSSFELDNKYNALSIKDKFKLNMYLRSLPKNEFSSIVYLGNLKGAVVVNLLINADGTLLDVKVKSSTYNLDFNNQIVEQIKAIKYPKLDANIHQINALYQFTNI